MYILLCFLLLFNTFDVFATSVLMKVDGFTEANMLANFVIESWGYIPLLLIKYTFCILLFSTIIRINSIFYQKLLVYTVIIYFVLNTYQIVLLAIV